MNVLKTLIVQEFKLKISSYKFSVLLIISFIISIFSIYLQLENFENRFEKYQFEKTFTENSTNKIKVYSDIKIPILIPPNPLSIFSKGYDDIAGNKTYISTLNQPILEKTIQSKNPYSSIFTEMDLTKVMYLILSIILILMSAEIIPQEREDQVYGMIFSNQIKKYHYYMSKFFAISLLNIIVLGIIYIFTLVFISCSDFIELNLMLIFKITLIFLSYFIYLTFFVLLGLLISSRMKSTSNSVLLSLFFWLFINILYPNIVIYGAKTLQNNNSRQVIDENIKTIWSDFENKVEDWEEINYHNLDPGYINYRGSNYFVRFIGITEEYEFDYQEKKVVELFPFWIETINKLNEQELLRVKQLNRINNKSSFFLYLVPNHLIENTITVISNTDIKARYINLLKKIHQFYRIEFVDYLNLKNAIGIKFFSQMPYNEMQESIEDYSTQVRQKIGDYDNLPYQEINDLPFFEYKNSKLRIPLDIIILVLMNLILLVWGLSRFSKKLLN